METKIPQSMGNGMKCGESLHSHMCQRVIPNFLLLNPQLLNWFEYYNDVTLGDVIDPTHNHRKTIVIAQIIALNKEPWSNG